MSVVLSFPFDYPFIAYFLKKKYSLRQNILKILRVWERSLTLVPIGVYLDLIKVETWLGTSSTKDFEDLLEKEWPDAAPDSKVQRPVSSQEVNHYCEGVTGCWNSVLPASGQKVILRPVKRRRWRQDRPDSGCVRSVGTGRVQSWLEGIWTSLESTGLWVAASGRCHRSVRSVDNVRDSNSSLFPFPSRWGPLFNHAGVLT